MLYELKDALTPSDVFYINTKAVTSILCQPGSQQGIVNALITVTGSALRVVRLKEEELKAFLAEVQKTA